MTLTLDDVRNMKFRIARRSGYEVLDVDQFVDRVEEAFAQLTEENQQLKRQVADLTAAAEAASRASEDRAPEPPTWSAPEPEPEPAPSPATAPTSPASSAGDAEKIVVTTADEASPAVVRLVQLATEQAEQVVSDAREESAAILQKAQVEATGVTSQAVAQAERVESDARLAADRLRNESEAKARAFEEELKVRRRDAFSAMETERDQLKAAVGELRSFEKTYRSNLTDHLRSQISGLENATLEPKDTPGLLSSAPAEQSNSDTPRLDALLGGDSN